VAEQISIVEEATPHQNTKRVCVSDTSTPAENLPLDIIDHQGSTDKHAKSHMRRRKVWLIPVVILAVFFGGVVGLYFQPPGLRIFFNATGLQPGAGSGAPFALPAGVALPQDVVATLQPTDVIGLARLLPRGDIAVVAPPFGSGDARIAEISVQIGDLVSKGQILALLDNGSELNSAVAAAEADLAIQDATLARTRQSVALSRAEDEASLAEAQAIARAARAELDRTQSLFDRGITTQAQLDRAVSAAEQGERAAQRATATLARYQSDQLNDQPDVLVALRNLDAAKAALRKAQLDLNKGIISAPADGMVLDIYVRPGEDPGTDGVMVLGDVEQMMAEVEVHQSQIAGVVAGQPVELLADALHLTLNGTVERVGLLVQQQGIVAEDTAANTDARVIEVLVALDAPSSIRAARFTNLEVIARIDTREAAR
jgi:HlyD family secretion protein